MKRFLSLVLSLAMILPIMLAATPALAEENPYAEHLTFKVFTIDGSDDMFNWPLVKQAMEKFNFDFEIQLVAWDSWDESTRTLAYTQSLPEVIAWYNLNKDEYLEWVEEGVFKALPDDMSAYPNLEKLINSYTCFDQFRVDGKLYTFPKIKNSNPVNLYTTYMFAYRRDWAKAMGYDWAPVQTLTYDEFVAYLRDVKEKDPGHMGDKLVPLDLDNGGKHWAMLAQLWNQRIGSSTTTVCWRWTATTIPTTRVVNASSRAALLSCTATSARPSCRRLPVPSRPMSKASPTKTSASSASKRPTARSMSARSTSGGLRSPSPRTAATKSWIAGWRSATGCSNRNRLKPTLTA